MNVLVSPVHFRDVNQTFHPFLDFGKATVIGQIGHLRDHATALWVSASNSHPWVLTKLLETERYAVSLTIELKDFDIHLLSDFDDLARVLDALPRHVCDVEQSVNTTEVNEGTVIGEILDHALNRLAFLQVLQ